MRRKKLFAGVVLCLVVLVIGGFLLVQAMPQGGERADSGHTGDEDTAAEEFYFDAVVLEVYEGSVYVYQLLDGPSPGLCYVTLPQEADAADYEAGQLVRVVEPSIVQESFPPTYPVVREVRVLGPAGAEQYAAAQAAREEWEGQVGDMLEGIELPDPPAEPLEIVEMG